MPKVLVLGAHGFIGRNVAKHFQTQGFYVIGLGRGGWDASEAASWGVNAWHQGEVNSSNLMKIASNLDCVVNCSGGSSVAKSYQNPLADYENTVSATATIFQFLRDKHHKARFVFLSSPAVYGSCNPGPISEDAPKQPISPYGQHKSLAEQLCLEYAETEGIETKIIRLFSIYGTGLKKQLLWDACTKFAGGDVSPFWGDGKETRDWLHVSDAAELIYRVSTQDNVPNILNGGTGQAVTVNETLTLVFREFGQQPHFSFNGSVKTGDPRFFEANSAKARQLAWAPKVPLDIGIKQYVTWFKEIHHLD